MAGNNKVNGTSMIADFTNDVDVYELATFGSTHRDDYASPAAILASAVRAIGHGQVTTFTLANFGEMLLLFAIVAKRCGVTVPMMLQQAKNEAADVSTEYHRQLALMTGEGGKEPPDAA